MTTIPDHYAALGIDPTADPEVITAAYRALAKKFHPDTGAATGTASAERFDEIQRAYEVLRNPESRHAYDLELLAATEAELEAHIASKRRVVVRERQRAAEEAAAAAPDLGDIRPEPAVPPKVAAAARKPRALFPFIVPLLLMMLVGGAGAWMFLPAGPETPASPGKPEVAVAVPEQPAAPASAPQPEPAAQAPAAPAPAQATAEQPVFGSTGSAANPARIEAAAATPQDVPAPDAEGEVAAKSDKPVFGSSTSGNAAPAAAPDAPAAAAAPPPPVPKAKPAQPVVKQAQKPATQAKPVQKQAAPKPPAQQQPRVRLAYQDPPQYYPEPDGYPPPPPGLEPPGYYPDGYDAEMPPPGFRPPGRGPYRLVIFERPPGRPATAWSAGMVFKSIGKCTKQGVKAVLRRTGGMEPDGTRIWYECQQLSQR